MSTNELETLLNKYVLRYRREFDFYQEAARKVHSICESALLREGIRAIVSNRAKQEHSLIAKIRLRYPEEFYKSIEDITKDIVDLAGVRIALYFPSDLDRVGNIIRELFKVIKERQFPKARKPNKVYKNRFDGYRARHFRVHLNPDPLDKENNRYQDALVEIQVASVLMHAWAEVEHDLAYKPVNGTLSYEEYAILDEINGLVLHGERSLERLKSVSSSQTKKQDGFQNHYDLAAYLHEKVKSNMGDVRDNTMGRVDQLFELINIIGSNREDLQSYIDKLLQANERQPLAQQIIDQILYEQPELIEAIKFDVELNSITGMRYVSLFRKYMMALDLLINHLPPKYLKNGSEEGNPRLFTDFKPFAGITADNLLTIESLNRFRETYLTSPDGVPIKTIFMVIQIWKRYFSIIMQSEDEVVKRILESVLVESGFVGDELLF